MRLCLHQRWVRIQFIPAEFLQSGLLMTKRKNSIVVWWKHCKGCVLGQTCRRGQVQVWFMEQQAVQGGRSSGAMGNEAAVQWGMELWQVSAGQTEGKIMV